MLPPTGRLTISGLSGRRPPMNRVSLAASPPAPQRLGSMSGEIAPTSEGARVHGRRTSNPTTGRLYRVGRLYGLHNVTRRLGGMIR